MTFDYDTQPQVSCFWPNMSVIVLSLIPTLSTWILSISCLSVCQALADKKKKSVKLFSLLSLKAQNPKTLLQGVPLLFFVLEFKFVVSIFHILSCCSGFALHFQFSVICSLLWHLYSSVLLLCKFEDIIKWVYLTLLSYARKAIEYNLDLSSDHGYWLDCWYDGSSYNIKYLNINLDLGTLNRRQLDSSCRGCYWFCWFARLDDVGFLILIWIWCSWRRRCNPDGDDERVGLLSFGVLVLCAVKIQHLLYLKLLICNFTLICDCDLNIVNDHLMHFSR